MTHVQNQSQEVDSEHEGLSLFGFDFSSAETDFDGWRTSSRKKENQYMASIWGQWLQKLEDLRAAPDELDHACREARDFASQFRVSYDILCTSWKRSSPCFQHVPTRMVVLMQLSQSIHTSREA